MDNKNESTARSPTVKVVNNTWIAWLTLLFGLTLTAVAAIEISIFIKQEDEKAFIARTTEFSNAINNRLISYEQVLWGGVSFVSATGEFDRDMWRRYVEKLDVGRQWPGIQGFGVSIPISAAEKSQHITEIRDEGFPDYTIKPEGERDEYSAIVFLEPFDWRNQRAFGYDMWSNEIRRVAMARARDTGLASTSGIITLVQETESDVQRGFLTYVPIYQRDVPLTNIDERRQAFLGWVYSPFRMGDLMQGVLETNDTDIQFEIYDNGQISEESLLYTSFAPDHTFDGENADEMIRQYDLISQGRKWTIRYSSQTGFGAGPKHFIAWIIGVTGTIVNFLLFYINRSLSNLRVRAETIAEQKTASLVQETRNAEDAHKKTVEANLELALQKEALDEHAIVSITDTSGQIIYANDNLCSISGYSRSELLGLECLIFKPELHSEATYRELWKNIRNGKPWSGEIKNRKKDGEFYWVLVTVVPFVNTEGKIVKYVSIQTDITDHIAAQRNIREFKTTLDLLQDSVRIFEPDTLKYTYGNQTARDIDGYSEDEFIKLTLFDLVTDFDEDRFRKLTQELVAGTHASEIYNIVTPDKEGKDIHLEISMQYIAPVDEPPRFISISRDATERYKVDKAKSEFVSIVSHELRTPLTSIKGALGLIQSGKLGELPAPLKTMLRIAHDNTDRLILLINDILDMEKLGIGKMKFDMRPFDIVALVDMAIEANKNYGEQRDVIFVNASKTDPLMVLGDKDRLMQVMYNLLSNAAKFSPSDGGEVVISATHNEDKICIAVKDHGVGIPSSAKGTIFDKFSQADTTDERKNEGTGLGLNIVKMIVDAHGGEIRFENNPEAGVTFYVEFPELKTGEGISKNNALDSLGTQKALICENEPYVAAIIANIFKEAGFTVVFAGSTQLARTLLDTEKFDYMTFDLDMSDQDDVNFLVEMRTNPNNAELCILVISDSAEQDIQIIKGEGIGKYEWAQKPIDVKALVEKMKTLFGT